MEKIHKYGLIQIVILLQDKQEVVEVQVLPQVLQNIIAEMDQRQVPQETCMEYMI